MARNIMWSKKYLNCKNCDSNRYPYLAKGYCKKCYPLVLRLEKVKKWDYKNNYPKELNQNIDLKTFTKMKIVADKQLKQRLNWIRIREKKLKEDIFGIDLEYAFGRLAKYCGVKDNGLFHNTANTFDHNFSMKQRKIIFGLVDDIEQNIKWKGIDWSEIIFLK